MPYNAIVSDWNGTLFEYPTDKAQNKKIAYAVLNDVTSGLKRGNVLKLLSIGKLLFAKKQINKRLAEYEAGDRELWEVYAPFNKHVIGGQPIDIINSAVDDYARESVSKVDGRMMRPIRTAHSRGAHTGILSVSYDYSIRKILEESGHTDVFDHVVANELIMEQGIQGIAKGIGLNIYGKKRDVFVDEFLRGKGFSDRTTIYIGDTNDDEPVAEAISRGHFVVPFFAQDEFKQHMASQYGAFVPEDEADFARFLEP